MKAAKLLLVAICCCVLSGCSVVEYFRREGPPYDRELYESYGRTLLRTSSSVDVLTTIHRSEREVLSQSKSVIASAGQKKKGRKIWLNMVAFDEDEPTARRKYILIVDDRPNLMQDARKSLSFDCEMILERDVLDEPYANENARRIAILRQVLKYARDDIDKVGSDNKTLDISGMLIKQALGIALVRLDSSAVLASKLSEPAGLDFNHISLGKGKIQTLLEYDIVKVKMRLGRPVKKWEKSLKKGVEKTDAIASRGN